MLDASEEHLLIGDMRGLEDDLVPILLATPPFVHLLHQAVSPRLEHRQS